MSLDDREWYRAEMARRRSASRTKARPLPKLLARINARPALKLISGAVATAAVALAVLPVTVTPRCTLDNWTSTPEGCWLWSWSELTDRVAGNMAATRGWPFVIVQTGGGSIAPEQRLPDVITPSRR